MFDKKELESTLQFIVEQYAASQLKKEYSENNLRINGLDVSTKNYKGAKTESIKEIKIQEETGTSLVFLIGPAAMLFSVKDESFREQLVVEHKIAGVVTLKNRIVEGYMLPSSIIVFGDAHKQEKTWFSTAWTFGMLANLMISGEPEGQDIYYSDSVNPKNLSPSFYNPENQVGNVAIDNSPVKELCEIAEVIAGKSVSSSEYKVNGIAYLRGGDISGGKVKTPKVYIDQETAQKCAKQLLQDGDILLTKNFGQNKIAFITEDDLPAVASNNLFIIRPFGVSEEYLYKYLTSETGKKAFDAQLNKITKGITVPSVSLSDILHVQIPIYDEETTQQIINVDSLSLSDTKEMIKKILSHVEHPAQLEKLIYESLISSGWNPSSFIKDGWVQLDDKSRFMADFTYALEDGRKILIETKTDFSKVHHRWVNHMRNLISHHKECIVILTTGYYYEVHLSGETCSLKLLHTPTVQEILDWEKEVKHHGCQ